MCPENRAVVGRFDDGGEFSEDETGYILEAIPLDQLPKKTAAKLQSLELNEDYTALCRNRALLLQAQAAPGAAAQAN